MDLEETTEDIQEQKKRKCNCQLEEEQNGVLMAFTKVKGIRICINCGFEKMEYCVNVD